MGRMSPRALVALGSAVGAMAAAGVIAACGSTSSQSSEPRARPASAGRLSAIGPKPPLQLAARRMRPRSWPRLVPRGTIVGRSDLFGDRVFANASHGFALANQGNAQYPVLSTDGGRRWKIDGPQLHVDAADGAEGVGSVGTAGPRTWFAYGSSVVDVTTDGGHIWWETYMGELVMAVVPGADHELVAYVQESTSSEHASPAVTWQYVSDDGGRQWRYSTALGG